jgi:two-component system sensor histidine kinase MprB
VSLRLRIAGAAGAAVAVAVVLAAVIVYLAIRSELRGEVENGLRDIARAAAYDRQPHGGGGNGRPDDVRPPPDVAFGGPRGYLQFVSPQGTAKRPAGESDVLPISERARQIAKAGAGDDVTDAHVEGHHLLVYTAGIGDRGAIQVARPLDEVDSELDRVLIILVLVGAAGIALAAALGLLVSHTALAPIARFTSRTEHLAEELDLSERIDVVGRDELARLAHSFNTTLDALERAVASQRQLVADASHELRTPIASLRANVQILEDVDQLPREELDALRHDIIAELDELTTLVGDVVELARGDQPAGELDDVRLDEVVTALVARAERRANAPAFHVEVEPTVIRGEPERIGRAVSNLIDNACKWNAPGRPVEVRLKGGVVEVRDHGPGFAEEDLPHVFERFYRADNARGRPGSGLGLAIVQQAAEAHGGSVEAANAAGGGAVLRLRFTPAAAS